MKTLRRPASLHRRSVAGETPSTRLASERPTQSGSRSAERDKIYSNLSERDRLAHCTTSLTNLARVILDRYGRARAGPRCTETPDAVVVAGKRHLHDIDLRRLRRDSNIFPDPDSLQPRTPPEPKRSPQKGRRNEIDGRVALDLRAAASFVASPTLGDVSTTQPLPAAACNQGTMNAHEHVPEMTGSGG